MAETLTKEAIISELTSTIAGVNLEYLREDVADLNAEDTEKASAIRDKIEAAIAKLAEYSKLAADILGGEPERGDARTLGRAESLLSEEDGLPALLKEVEALIPSEAAAEEEDTVSEKERDDERFAELLQIFNEAKSIAAIKSAGNEMFLFMKELADKKTVALVEADAVEADDEATLPKKKKRGLSKDEKSKQKTKIRLGLEKFEEREERLTGAAEKASRGRSGIKIRRLWERATAVPLSAINAEVGSKMRERSAVTSVLGKSLRIINTEFSLRNTFEDLAIAGNKLANLKSIEHVGDMLAFAKFLVEVGLIDSYDPDAIGENDEALQEDLNRYGRRVRNIKNSTANLVEAYNEADQKHEKTFKKYIKRQAPFFAAILGGKAVEPEAAPAEEPAAAESEAAPAEEPAPTEEPAAAESEAAPAEDEDKPEPLNIG